MLENVENPHEDEQDLRETIREEYRKSEEPEETEDSEVNERPIDDIEVKEPDTDSALSQLESEADQEIKEPESLDLPELTPNDLWPAEFKEKFPTLPRDAQQFLIDTHRNMQTGLNQKFTEVADQRKNIEAIEQAYQPLEQFARVNGMQTSQIAIQAAQHIQNILHDPIPGTKAFLKSMGVDVNQLIENEEYVDPQLQAVNQELHQLKQQRQYEQQQQQQQGIAQAQQVLNAFINEVNEHGHLKHQRYEELRPVMHMYYQNDVQSGQPEKPLQEYYAMAERFTAAQNPVQPADPQAIKEPATLEKKKVASKNIKSKTNTKAPAELSMREQIRRDYRSGKY